MGNERAARNGKLDVGLEKQSDQGMAWGMEEMVIVKQYKLETREGITIEETFAVVSFVGVVVSSVVAVASFVDVVVSSVVAVASFVGVVVSSVASVDVALRIGS
ncbi:hypothetical protein HOLleu_31630 [Holothuria leucospilota]|uniref:Uncharacterized protein n=1 Tax=Holothuria leucospilota TaxID=206669 RepID=A0A9Q0YSE2_HOLLE|nr:hypothetical protein HOLleu_31630 [Holothuria leucospilota]